ncbi:hypothetical protein [Acinetobacter brisouii]|uniref:hypothetical protein n=1 Tax=Acinetobacter brisouii TaxID=396323 RepID=UPI00125098E5|nr:hypothetical protein [Acinetobacter brisouii]
MQGLQVFNASGALVQDVTDRCSRVLGFYQLTSRGNGFYTLTITDDKFREGTPFIIPFQNATTVSVQWYTINYGYQKITSSASSFYGLTLNDNVLTINLRVWGASIPTQLLMYGVY